MPRRTPSSRLRGTIPSQDAPTIALVGRPNVGKSTLFNLLTRSRKALVAPVPGTTRDRREGAVERGEYAFRLIDTGGMGFGDNMAFSGEVEEQVGAALKEAGLVWMLMDGKEGLNPFDLEMYHWIAKQGIPCLAVVNKVDNERRHAEMTEFYRLGVNHLHAVSALHNSGLEALLKASRALFPKIAPNNRAPGQPAGVNEHHVGPGDDPELGEPESPDEDSASEGPLRIAFVGRPNVGKSSLINRVLNEGRMIVSDVAGTTREAVEIPFEREGESYLLVDTAGIRRKARTKEYLEKIGVLQSLGALDRVDVAILVVDGTEPLAVQDARIANYILEHRRAVVVAINKWDQVRGNQAHQKEVEFEAREKLRFMDFAPAIRTSAATGAGLDQLFKEVHKAAAQFRRRLQTSDLNRMVQATVARFPPPAQGRSPTRIYYGTQIAASPPYFRLFTNHPKQIGDSYTRFFEHQLRHAFGFKGSPLRIEWRGRDEGEAAKGAAERKRIHAGTPARTKPGGRREKANARRSGKPR